MQSVEFKIEKAIKSKPKGQLLFPEDFSHKGSAESVRKALQSLKEKGLIKTVTHGIYIRPIIDDYIGEVLPSAEEVAKAIAKRDKIRLVPTGVYALHALGLSTQIPLKLVFLTDGAPRTIKVGRRTIKLKKTTPKNLKTKGKISALAIQALREIGKDKASEDELSKLIKLLKEEDSADLKYDISLAPEWIKKIMKQAVHEQQPQTINIIPSQELMSAWAADYKAMQEQMIYGDSPNFGELIEALKSLNNWINNKKWKMKCAFPTPNT